VIDKLTTCLSTRHSNPFDQRLVAPSCIVERGFELGGWDVAEVAVETAGVVPVHPALRGQLDVLDGLPGAGSGRSVDQFGLVVSVDRVLQHAITGGCTVPGGTHPMV